MRALLIVSTLAVGVVSGRCSASAPDAVAEILGAWSKRAEAVKEGEIRWSVPAENWNRFGRFETEWVPASDAAGRDVTGTLRFDEQRACYDSTSFSFAEYAALSAQQTVDVWLIGMIVLDVGLLVAIGYMLFWPAHKRFSWRPKDVESTLQRLNQRIERNPDVVRFLADVVRFLATRARLLADSGRPEEAIADIDRILEQGPRGVDLEKWRQLRAKLARKATEKTAR